MFNFLGEILILVGVLWMVLGRKYIKGIDIGFILYNNNNNYEVVNEEKFMLLQKAKYYMAGICYIITGVVWMFFGPEWIVLGLIPTLISPIISFIGKKYVRVKYNESNNSK